jgi:lactoylglutathione lyase
MSAKNHFLDFLSLQVKDINLSKEYYTKVLGFNLAQIQPQPNAIVLENDAGAVFAIKLPIDDIDKSYKLGFGITPWFAVTDIFALFENIKKNKGNLLQEQPQEGPFGIFFNTIDPDGYLLTFHQIKS